MSLRILYGVQATGQGHISRARAMAEAFTSQDADVTWLFSGRPQHQLFDMEPFGDYLHRSGLTFVTENGRTRYRKTVLNAKPWTFIRDVRALCLDDYDLIVTDYEPVTAWAGKMAGREVIGLGHQYAFGSNTPKAGANLLQQTVMEYFAPVARPVGLHWGPFNTHTLPPILDLPTVYTDPVQHFVLVYLPFEHQNDVTIWLQQFSDYRFVQYSNDITDIDVGNVQRRKASITRFKQDLAHCSGVICNSGFELISECLQWQKPVLTKPLQRQMEQLSNAKALSQLGYAEIMHRLDSTRTLQWLNNRPNAPTVHYLDVAHRLAAWLSAGAKDPIAELHAALWQI